MESAQEVKYQWYRDKGWEFYDELYNGAIIMRKNVSSITDNYSWIYITILMDGTIQQGIPAE